MAVKQPTLIETVSYLRHQSWPGYFCPRVRSRQFFSAPISS